MSRRHRAWVLALACGLGGAEVALGQVPGQPYASYWHPATILNWDPVTDADAAFNRSNVPLASRIFNPYNVNPNARVGQAGVTALVAYGPTSNNPSQGSAAMKYYATNYWQYMDNLVFWGGSASEGLILAPNATVIDAAHRNGVRVLGNVFFPPTAYGGQIKWVNEFLQQRTDGSFPVADKMIQAAQYYGFDGWFINQETAGGNSTTATKMQSFIKYVKARAPGLHVQWYDSMTSSGSISWQGALNSSNSMFYDTDSVANSGKVADSMFLDFRWSSNSLANSANTASSLGRSRYELYAGIDVEGGGYNTSVNWNGIFPGGSHQTSLGIYRPEWTNNSAGSVADFYARDNKFWVGPNGDPSNTTTGDAWKGIANYIPAKSAVKSGPFVTNFNTGQGNRYMINGQQLASGEWNNLSVQDVLPTYRWMISSTGTKLTPSLDFNDAYYGGTSLLVSGNLGAVNDLRLYQTAIPVASDTKFRIALKPNAANPLMKLGVSFTDNPESFTYIDVGSGMTSGQWNSVVLSLGAHAGKTLANIALRFGDGTTTINGYSTRIGQFAVYNGAISTPAAPANPYIDNPMPVSQSGATSTSLPLRVHWTHSTDAPYVYNLYRKNPDGSLAFLGATPNNAYFVQGVKRIGSENFVTLELETVGLDFGTSPRSTMSFYVDWPRSAQTLTWQPGGAAGGSGTWDATSLSWKAGASAPAKQYWTSTRNDSVVFTGMGGAVAVTTPVSVGNMTFGADGFVLYGGNAVTLNSSLVMIANAAHTATISTPLAGGAGLRKVGSGTLVLGGTHTYTGPTQVSGVLRVNGSIAASSGVTVTAGTFEVAASQAVKALTINSSGRGVILESSGSPKVLTTGSLAMAEGGMFDVGNNVLVVGADAATREDVLEEISGWIRSGRNGGAWDGVGMTTSAATGLTGLAAVINDKGDGTPLNAKWGVNAVVVKYTWNGDVNLDGEVNLNDYFVVDSNYLTQTAGQWLGYAKGDLNLDGEINLNDYFMIDSAYLGQSGVLASMMATTPEPGGLVGVGAVVGWLMGRRNRK